MANTDFQEIDIFNCKFQVYFILFFSTCFEGVDDNLLAIVSFTNP